MCEALTDAGNFLHVTPSTCKHTSAHASIRQASRHPLHLQAYVSTRQHTSGITSPPPPASIRQHTPAHVRQSSCCQSASSALPPAMYLQRATERMTQRLIGAAAGREGSGYDNRFQQTARMRLNEIKTDIVVPNGRYCSTRQHSVIRSNNRLQQTGRMRLN
jgi:hypothetical protein